MESTSTLRPTATRPTTLRVGIAGCGTLLNDRTNLHFLRIAEHLNSTNTALTNLLKRASIGDLAVNGGNSLLATGQALKQLRVLVVREAQTQTFADIFLVIMACFVVATILVPLLKNTPTPAAPPADAH